MSRRAKGRRPRRPLGEAVPGGGLGFRECPTARSATSRPSTIPGFRSPSCAAARWRPIAPAWMKRTLKRRCGSRGLRSLLPPTTVLELTAEAYSHWGETASLEAESAPPGKAELLRRLAGAMAAGGNRLLSPGPTGDRRARISRPAVELRDRVFPGAGLSQRGPRPPPLPEEPNAAAASAGPGRPGRSPALPGRAGPGAGGPEGVHRRLFPRPDGLSRPPAGQPRLRRKKPVRQAEALLRENLEGEGLTPDSREWRDSLFALGELLHSQKGREAEAIVRLEEAIERYGDLPRTVTARYLLADSCRRAAEAIGAGARGGEIGGAARRRRRGRKSSSSRPCSSIAASSRNWEAAATHS